MPRAWAHGATAVLCGWIALVGTAQTGQAQTRELPTALQESVRAQVAHAWDVEASTIVLEWGRLPRGRAVDTTLAPELSGSGRGGDWVVRLSSPDGAFGVRVRAGVERMQPVASKALERGAILAAHDIRYEPRTQWGAPAQPASDPRGWEVQRSLLPGTPLTDPAVRPSAVLHAGDRVQVLWTSGRVQLALTGVAIGTAREGQSVAVRLDTGRRVRGTATANGAVRIATGPNSTGERQ